MTKSELLKEQADALKSYDIVKINIINNKLYQLRENERAEIARKKEAEFEKKAEERAQIYASKHKEDFINDFFS